MKLLLVGIDNQIGERIIPFLTQSGHDVWIITSDATHQSQYQQMGLHVIVGDIAENGRWIDVIPTGLDAIINLTQPHIQGHLTLKNIENDIAGHMLRIGQNLTYIATAKNVSWIIQPAPIYYYAHESNALLNESAPRNKSPEDYGLIYHSLISHLLGKKEIQTTLCISGHFIYNSDGQTLPEIPKVMDKNYVISGAGENYLHLTHIEDAVGALVHIIEKQIREPIINVVDNKPLLQKDFIKILSQRQHLLPPVPMPLGMVGVLFGDAYAKSVSQSIALKNDKLKESGYWFKFPDYTSGLSTQLLR